MATASFGLDKDDVSVATPQTGNRPIPHDSEVKEFVVKFLFRPKGGNNNTEVACAHYAILRSISNIYPEVQIFGNFGKAMREFPSIKSYDAYLHHFKLQFVKANENKNRKAIYLVFHRLRSPVSLGEIRHHATIAALLQKVKTRLSVHHWTGDEMQIANLGFFVGFDPGNILQDEMEQRVRQNINAITKRAIRKISRFHCGFSSPFLIDAAGSRISTKAYDLQWRQQDAKDMLDLLQRTYQQHLIFIFHRIQHKDPDVYHYSIRRQNSFLPSSRVIPIQLISSDVMFYVSSNLRSLPGVLDVAHHKLAGDRGRWSIFTTSAHFKSVLTLIEEKLPPWVAMHCSEHQLDISNLLPLGFAFRTEPFDESSDGSFESCVSACSTFHSHQSADFSLGQSLYDHSPVGSAPTQQAWSTSLPPSVIHAAPLPSTDSPILQEAFDRVTRENDRLSRDLRAFSDKFQLLLTASQHREFAPALTSAPVVSPTDIEKNYCCHHAISVSSFTTSPGLVADLGRFY